MAHAGEHAVMSPAMVNYFEGDSHSGMAADFRQLDVCTDRCPFVNLEWTDFEVFSQLRFKPVCACPAHA